MRTNFRFNQAVAKHIDRRKFFGWTIGLALPIAIALSFFIGWHNSVVGNVRPIHLLLRGALGFVGFGAVMVVVYCKAVRPAARKAREETDSRSPSQKR